MSNVTDANQNILVNLKAEAATVDLEFFSIDPATLLRVVLKRDQAIVFDGVVTADPKTEIACPLCFQPVPTAEKCRQRSGPSMAKS
jgi:hypothetical protein